MFGGRAANPKPLHVNKPYSASRDSYDHYFDRAWEASWFTNDGPLVQEFERRLANYLGVKDCVLVANGTLALELTLRALNLKGEVIIPSYTFVSTVNTLTLMGLEPIFCDIDPATLNLCPNACADLINERTSAIIPTHVWGRPCEIAQLEEICNRHKLKLLFDSAHAFGCEFNNRKIGTFGDAEVFSLHATKVLHSFEGGFIATQNSSLANALRVSRNFGFTQFDDIEFPGVNAKMSESHAAMGLANLDNFEKTLLLAKARYNSYALHLSELPGLKFRSTTEQWVSNHHYVVVQVDAERYGLTRDEIVNILRAENVLARKYFFPGCHGMTPYRSKFKQTNRTLPHTDAACENSLVLPAGAGIEITQVRTICQLLHFLSKNAPQIRQKAAAMTSKTARE